MNSYLYIILIQFSRNNLHYIFYHPMAGVLSIVGYCATRLVNDACDVKVKSETQAKGVKTEK